MKNKIFKYTIIASLLTVFGCQSDFFDPKLDFYHTPETIVTDRATLWSFANAFYAYIPYGFTSLDGNLFAAATDEAQQTVVGGATLIFNSGTMNARSIPDNNYKGLYDGIRAANLFLSYAEANKNILSLNRDTISDAKAYSDDKYNLGFYIAEAHIAKAYYYAELIKRYGGVPIINTTFQEATSLYVPRASYDSVVNFIVSEIDNNRWNLVPNWKTPPTGTGAAVTSDGRFSLGSALALKARVLLYAASPLHNPTNDVAKWEKAAAASKELISYTTLGYALDANYATYFVGANTLNSKETIFAVRRAASNSIEKANYPIATPGGNSGVCPTHNLVAAYEYIGAVNPTNPYLNRDPRLAASIVFNGSTWNSRLIDQSAGGMDDMAKTNTSKTGYYLKKFLKDNLNLVQGATEQHHWIMFRYGALLLEYAEAMNEAYGPDALPVGYTLSAKAALTNVRKRASALLPAITTTDKDEFRDIVKHERMVELAFEDQRYWDLLRWKDAETVLNQPVTGVKITKVDGVNTYEVVNVANRSFTAPMHYYYPFSYSEVAISKGTLEQNSGY